MRHSTKDLKILKAKFTKEKISDSVGSEFEPSQKSDQHRQVDDQQHIGLAVHDAIQSQYVLNQEVGQVSAKVAALSVEEMVLLF